MLIYDLNWRDKQVVAKGLIWDDLVGSPFKSVKTRVLRNVATHDMGFIKSGFWRFNHVVASPNRVAYLQIHFPVYVHFCSLSSLVRGAPVGVDSHAFTCWETGSPFNAHAGLWSCYAASGAEREGRAPQERREESKHGRCLGSPTKIYCILGWTTCGTVLFAVWRKCGSILESSNFKGKHAGCGFLGIYASPALVYFLVSVFGAWAAASIRGFC